MSQSAVLEVSDGAPEECPECGGRTGAAPDRCEVTCNECGLVVTVDSIDRGPEWRVFDQEDKQRRRTGDPITPTLPDNGLTTLIGCYDIDGKGHTLSSHQRAKLHRLRKWNNHYESLTERHLKKAFTEISRIVGALGLPSSVRETASVIYRQGHSKGTAQGAGRSIESVAAASVYATARLEQFPRSLDEVTIVAQVERKWIGRAYSDIISTLDLSIEPTNPITFLPRFVSELGCSEAVHRRARAHLKSIIDTSFMNGKCPEGMAAAALYAASHQLDEDYTQSEIGEVANVTNKTIRDQYRYFLIHD